jgi:hypothetical protein
MNLPLEIALAYIRRGWSPVPVPHKSKKPLKDVWQNLRITEADARQWFNGESQNVGVVLGTASGGLADVDLESLETVAAAPFFLPRTMTFGRSSKRFSHWLYKTDLAATADIATIKFTDTQKPARVLLEIRICGGGKGAQTVFPGSVHPSGEAIEWEDRREVAVIDGGVLKRICGLVAACALLARAYPQQGGRHEGVVVAGFLCRCGLVAPDVVRGRLDALIGRTVFEAKRDLAKELGDVERKMPRSAGIGGAVESDFFDWVVADADGEELVRRIMNHVRRFRLVEVESDILKILYESRCLWEARPTGRCFVRALRWCRACCALSSAKRWGGLARTRARARSCHSKGIANVPKRSLRKSRRPGKGHAIQDNDARRKAPRR